MTKRRMANGKLMHKAQSEGGRAGRRDDEAKAGAMTKQRPEQWSTEIFRGAKSAPQTTQTHTASLFKLFFSFLLSAAEIVQIFTTFNNFLLLAAKIMQISTTFGDF